jgi:hypothetical protein
MASIIKTSINLNDIPKDKIYVGKKGKYLPITITLNDEPDGQPAAPAPAPQQVEDDLPF